MSPMKFTKPFRRKHSTTAATDDARQRPVSSAEGGHAHTESSFRVIPRPDAAHTFEGNSPSTPRSLFVPGQQSGDGYLNRPVTVSNDSYEDNVFHGLNSRYVNDRPSTFNHNEHDAAMSKSPKKRDHKKGQRLAPRWLNHRSKSFENAKVAAAAASTPTLPHIPSNKSTTRFHAPFKQPVSTSTSSSRTNHSAGSASMDSSSAKEHSNPSTPSTQDTTFEPPQPIADPSSHRILSGRAFSFGSNKKLPFISPKPSRMRADTTATTETPPPKLPDSLAVGIGSDSNGGNGDFNMHMFDTITFSENNGGPKSPARRTPSPGSNVPQANTVSTKHDNSSSSSLKPPEAEKSRRASILSGLQGLRNKMSKNSTAGNSTQASSSQPLPEPFPESTSTPTTDEPFAAGSLLSGNTSYEDRLRNESLGKPTITSRHSATVPLPDTRATGNSTVPMMSDRRTWAGGNTGTASNGRSEAVSQQARHVKIEADSDDDDDDEGVAPLFPPHAKSPLIEMATAARTSTPKSPLVDRSPVTNPQKTDNDINTPRKSSNGGVDDLSADASVAAQFEEVSLKEEPPKKVMTEAQYARLREETAEASDDEDDAESYIQDIEDEDDRKQKREAQQQRLKQQAMLAIQRQRMMKVTDGSSPAISNRASVADLHTSIIGASASSPNLVSNKSSPHSSLVDANSIHKSDSSKDPNEDEDEDIPLGILAKHGFPNKKRPPSKLMASSSNPNLPSTPGSVNSDYFPQPGIQGGLPPSLPPFARNLPRDPYYGAGLVHHNPRESLAMGRGQQQPTAGLVGVIANEENARASRKRSPNHGAGPMYTGTQPAGMMRNSVYGTPAPPQGNFPPMPQQPMAAPPAAPQLVSPDLMQMSMFQTQMQMFELLAKMNKQSTSSAPQQIAPSYGVQGGMGGPMGPPPMMMNQPGVGQRAMSMVDSNAMNRMTLVPPPPIGGGASPRPGSAGARPLYAASVAPSERSNIGAASRYRPVSVQHSHVPRSSTVPPPNLIDETPGSRKGSFAGVPPFEAPSFANGHKPSSSNGSNFSMQRTQTAPVMSAETPRIAVPKDNDDDDDDDEQAWLQMRRAREQNKGTWKFKRSSEANLTEVAS